jgi:hypothetical protein
VNKPGIYRSWTEAFQKIVGWIIVSLILLMVVLLLMGGVFWTVDHVFGAPLPAKAPVASAKAAAPSYDDEARMRLASFGYVVSSPARYEKAVRHWQKVNGLVVDGDVGTQTIGSLRAAEPATASAPAKRLNPPAPVVTSAGPDCAEMSEYRKAAGLPEQFDSIGYRESRCDNGVGNSCCFGWWANYLSSHLSRASAYRERIVGECGVTSSARSEIQGDSDAQKKAQACVTYVVWSISGMSPWAL